MYQLFIANKNYSSWSLRPWILMRQLQIPFEEKIFSFGSRAFRDFSPSGRVPCLHDGDIVIWDSLAIVEYLAERHGSVWSEDKKIRAWERSAAAEMHSGFNALRQYCSMNCGLRVRLNECPDALQRDILRIEELWTEGLERFGGPYLSGSQFHAADAFFAPVAFRVNTYGLKLDEAASGYVRTLLALPAMQNWYEAALLEPWRDLAHEAEILQFGTILEDMRPTGIDSGTAE
ncbi:MAG: glutathione S-transferase family protein [Sterolibacterium sp.]